MIPVLFFLHILQQMLQHLLEKCFLFEKVWIVCAAPGDRGNGNSPSCHFGGAPFFKVCFGTPFFTEILHVEVKVMQKWTHLALFREFR